MHLQAHRAACSWAAPSCSKPTTIPARRQRRTVRCPAETNDGPVIMGDWREFRAKLISQEATETYIAKKQAHENMRLLQIQDPMLGAEEVWAHPTAGPEKGGLIIATPQANRILGNDKYWQTVIFIIDHNPKGSVGLILNRPSGMVMGRKPGGLPFVISGAPANMQATFDDNRVYCGGFTAQHIIHIMHGHRLHEAAEVVPGVFVGGEEAATDEVLDGRMDPSQFKFFSGAVVWDAGQLQQEIDDGAWYTAACARPLVLKQCLQLPTPLWQEMLQLMGGDYLSTAKAAYEGDE